MLDHGIHCASTVRLKLRNSYPCHRDTTKAWFVHHVYQMLIRLDSTFEMTMLAIEMQLQKRLELNANETNRTDLRRQGPMFSSTRTRYNEGFTQERSEKNKHTPLHRLYEEEYHFRQKVSAQLPLGRNTCRKEIRAS